MAVYVSNAVDQKIDLRLEPSIVCRLLEKIRTVYPGKRVDVSIFRHDDRFTKCGVTSERIADGFVEYTSNHHFCPPEPWLHMRGYRMPKSIAQTLRSSFKQSDLLALV
jgi:hypothetical protein